MTKWWRKYWKEKGHVRKGICDNLMGIDSFYIFKKDDYLTDCRESNFAFNDYDENLERILKVKIESGEFRFYLLEDRLYIQRELVADLLDEVFHVAFREFFFNSSVGHQTFVKGSSYKIPIERKQCNGRFA